MQHFQTASNKVKDRGWLNIGYNTQEVWEIQAGFEGVYCVFSGLRDKPHWQEFPVKWNKVQHLVKNWTKQLYEHSQPLRVHTSFLGHCYQ
jgi:hypothetical protein